MIYEFFLPLLKLLGRRHELWFLAFQRCAQWVVGFTCGAGLVFRNRFGPFCCRFHPFFNGCRRRILHTESATETWGQVDWIRIGQTCSSNRLSALRGRRRLLVTCLLNARRSFAVVIIFDLIRRIERNTGQNLHGILGHDHPCCFRRFESHHQTNPTSFAAHFVPRKPNAIGVSQLRLTVVGRKLFVSEDELSVRNAVYAVRDVKRIDCQLPGDFDGFFLLFAVEHDAAAKSANPFFSRFIQNGIRPENGDPRRTLDDGVEIQPGNSLTEVE